MAPESRPRWIALLDRILGEYFDTLAQRLIAAQKKKIQVEIPKINIPQPRVEVHPPKVEVKIPKIEVPEIRVPEIRVPEIRVPPAQVSVDKVRVENWPDWPIQKPFDDKRIVEGLKKLEQKTGGASGPTEYASGGDYTTGPFGNIPLWDDGGTLRAVSAVKPLPVDITEADIQIGAVEIKDGTTDNRAVVSAAGAVKVDGSAVTQPVSAVSLPLPAGAATAANQQTNALTDVELRASAVPISAASLPLPTGAATEATLALIKDTDGVKKITDALPTGSNTIGKVNQGSPAATSPWIARLMDVLGATLDIQPSGVSGLKVHIVGDSDKYVRSTQFASATSTAVSVGTGSTQVIAASSARMKVIIVNDSVNPVYLNYGGSATLNSGIRLNPLGGALVEDSYTGVINGIAGATSVVTVTSM